jgi:hypothetical protein
MDIVSVILFEYGSLFMYEVYNDADSEKWIGKAMEESGHGLI